MVDYVGQSTQANYTVLEGEGWVGLIMSETVSPCLLSSSLREVIER